MFRKSAVLAVLTAFMAAGNLFAAQINSNWVGGHGDWNVASNWSPAIVPDNGADTYAVTIDGSIETATAGFYDSFTITSLATYGDVHLERWEFGPIWGLTVLEGLNNYGSLHLDVSIHGDVTNNPNAYLQFYTHINIYGDLINSANAVMEFQNIDMDVEGDGDGGKIINNGLIRGIKNGNPGEEALFENNGSIELYGGGVSGAVFDNNDIGKIKGFGYVSGDHLQNDGVIEASGDQLFLGSGSVTNTGLMKVNPGADMFVTNLGFSFCDVNNEGEIEINAGGSLVCDSNLTNQSNSITMLSGGTLAAINITQKANANFTGFGGITGNVRIEPDAVIKLTGPTNIVGDVNIAENATLEISDGQTLITGHTVCDGTIHLIGGTVIFQGGCDCDGCNIINEAGTDRNHFDINADGIENLKDFAEFADDWLWQATWY
jgi:hypothetical protein